MKKRHTSKKNKSLYHVKDRFVKFLIIIGALTTISIIGLGTWQLRGVFNPISIEASSGNYTLNLGNNTLIVSFINDKKEIQQVHTIGLNTQEKTLRELIIPGNTVAVLPLGLEEYQLEQIFKVLPQENNLDLLQQALQNIAGTVSDGTVVIQIDAAPDSAIDWLSNPINIGQVALHPHWVENRVQSTFTRAQLVQYMWNISRTKPYNKRVHQVADSYIKSNIRLKDGTQVIRIDNIKGDILTKELFEKVPLVKERVPIRVVNATATNGLAGHVERLLSNAGANVVEVTTASERATNSKLVVHDPTLRDSYTSEIIRHVIFVSAPTEVEEARLHFKMSIVLGEDYASFMKGQ